MNALRKYFGIVWLLGGLSLAVYLIAQAVAALSAEGAGAEDYVFWIVIVLIFIPIVVGFILFGYYAYTGEYGDEKE